MELSIRSLTWTPRFFQCSGAEHYPLHEPATRFDSLSHLHQETRK